MALKLLLVAACSAAGFSCGAQSIQTLDLHRHKSKDAFYVVLASRGGSATGHAFVVWGVEDARTHRTTVRAEGLYPEGSSSSCGPQVRTVRGGMLDELKTHSFQSIDEELIVRVDEADYRRSREVAREWQCRREYSLFGRDCVEFVRAVGLSLGLAMPRRGVTDWTPRAYVHAVLSAADANPGLSKQPVVFP
jgi:hypothetical protein